MKERTWEELGSVIRTRRVELGLTQDEAARDAGLSVATWRLLETGGRTGYQELTLMAAARALRWPRDCIAMLLAGADPDELAGIQATPVGPAGVQDPHRPPAGLASKWAELTPMEQVRVEAFIDGILATRG